MAKGTRMLNLSRETIQKVRTIDSNPKLEKKEVINVKDIKSEIELEKTEEDVWDKVRKFYIQHASKPTYLETARRFNLGDKDVAQIARDEGWFEQRIIYWSQVAADKQQQIYQLNNNLFQGLSTVAQFSIREHARNMVDMEEKRKKNIIVKKTDYDETYDIAKTMNMIKILTSNMEAIQDQLGSDKELQDMDDDEILELLSEDEKYELDNYYDISEEEEEDDGMLND